MEYPSVGRSAVGRSVGQAVGQAGGNLEAGAGGKKHGSMEPGRHACILVWLCLLACFACALGMRA